MKCNCQILANKNELVNSYLFKDNSNDFIYYKLKIETIKLLNSSKNMLKIKLYDISYSILL